MNQLQTLFHIIIKLNKMTTHNFGLTHKQELAKFNEAIITINIVELASELADMDLRENWKDSIKIYEEDEDETSYTEEAQDVFNDLYDTYYSIIANAKV